MKNGTASHSKANRITMDCRSLREVIFAWDEEKNDYNAGGIFTAAGHISSSSLVLGESARISAGITDEYCLAPDVAIGAGGDSVYIAFIRRDPLLSAGSIEVVSDHFNNVATITDDDITSFSNIYTSSGYTTKLVEQPLNNHIRIDAPDNYEDPVWALVYLTDTTQLNTVVVDPSTFLRNEMFSLYSSVLSSFCSPAISYAPSALYISLGWYNSMDRLYYATKLTSSGLGFESPASSTVYFRISIDPNDGDCYYWGKIAFSTSQQAVFGGTTPLKGLFMAYANRINMINLEEMRSKEVRWNPPTVPFKHVLSSTSTTKYIYPNPLTTESKLAISDYSGEKIAVRMTDILGRKIWSMQGVGLQEVNEAITDIIPNLSSGTYLIEVYRDGVQETIKCSKN